MRPLTRELRPCRHCGALVLRTITAAGRPMAVDPRPDPKGNQAVYKDGLRVWRSRALNGRDAAPPYPHEHTYLPHVATCTPPAPRLVQPSLPGLVVPGLATVTRLDTRRRAKRRTTR